MIMRPLDAAEAMNLAWWRNACRYALRTGGWTTGLGQKAWAESINKPEGTIWYFGFHGEDGSDPFGMIAAGGIVNIDRFNRSCELALIVHPNERGKGHGKEAFLRLLEEAFEAQAMHRVWLEVFDCNPAKAWWYEQTKKFHPVVAKIPETKRWYGQWYGSTIFNIYEDSYRA